MSDSASSTDPEVQRLFRLVSAPLWKRNDAVRILIGIDPDVPLPYCHEPHGTYVGEIVWLANAKPREWQTLDADQLSKRAVHRLLIVNHRFWAAPPMTPFAWLSEGLRRGIEPPWLRPFAPVLERLWKASAAASFGDIRLLPLVPKYKTKNAGAKLVVFILWEAWQFGETRFARKADLIKAAQLKINNSEVDDKEIRRWIDLWEQTSGAIYERSSRSPFLWDPLSHAADPELLKFKQGKRRK